MKRRKYYRQVKDNVKAEKRRKAVQRQELFQTITKSLKQQGVRINYDTSVNATNLNLVTDVYSRIQPEVDSFIQNVQTQTPTSTTTTREEYELLDQCGVCGGGVYECDILNFNTTDCGTPGSLSWMDCTGTCFGDTLVSNCGVCGGTDNTPNEGTCDCAGQPNGSSYVNHCGDCVTSETDTCVQDCNNVWGGDAFVDLCGYCVGGDTGFEEGWADSGCGCNRSGPVITYPDRDNDRLGECLPCQGIVEEVAGYIFIGTGEENYGSCTGPAIDCLTHGGNTNLNNHSPTECCALRLGGNASDYVAELCDPNVGDNPSYEVYASYQCIVSNVISSCSGLYPDAFQGAYNEDCIPRDENNNCCIKYFCLDINPDDYYGDGSDSWFPVYNEASTNFVFNYDDGDGNCNPFESTFPMCDGQPSTLPLSEIADGHQNCGFAPFLDYCGLCPNNTFDFTLDNDTSHTYSYNNSKDCNDDCLGTAYVDECGVCCGGNTGVQCSIGPNQGAKDCYGVCNGGNLEYECDSSHLDFAGGAVNTFCGCPVGAANCGDNQHEYQQFIDCNGVCFYHTSGGVPCDDSLPLSEQSNECLQYRKNNLDLYGHCCLTGNLDGDESEIVTAYADSDSDGVGNTGADTIQICSTAEEPFYIYSTNYYWTQIGDDCIGDLDDCGVCEGGNVNMDNCGVCHVPPCESWNDGTGPSDCTDWNSSCVGCMSPGSVNFDESAIVPCDNNIGSGCINNQTGINCCCESQEDFLDTNCTLSDVISAGNDDCDTGDVCLPDGYIDPSTCLVDDIEGCCATQVDSQDTGGGAPFCETIGCMNLCYTTNYADPYCCPDQDLLVISDDEVTEGYNSNNYACDNIYYQAWCLENDFGAGPDYPAVSVGEFAINYETFQQFNLFNFVTNFSDTDISLNGENKLSQYYSGVFDSYGLDNIYITSTINQEINIVERTYSNPPFELTGETLSVVAGESIWAQYDLSGGTESWFIKSSGIYLEDFIIKPGQAFAFSKYGTFQGVLGDFDLK